MTYLGGGMKRIALVLVVSLLVGSFAFGIDNSISVSGDTTLTWGFQGQLLDNSGTYLGAEDVAADGTGWTDADNTRGSFFDIFVDSSDSNTADPREVSASVTVTNAEGVDIFTASTTTVAGYIPTSDTGTPNFGFKSIAFPNVLPGTLGVTLTDNTVTLNATPLPENGPMALSADVGLSVTDPIRVYSTNGTYTDVETAVAADGSWWVSGITYDYAASLDLSYSMDLSKDDSVSVDLGTSFDSAWGKAWDVDTNDDGITTGTWKAATASDASDRKSVV